MSHWTDRVEAILDGDHVLMLSYATPANGTVMLPLNNFAVHDREAGTIASANSSVGVWRKLDRIRRNPNVALAFHTREHSRTDRPEYVLVQGRATLGEPIPDYPSTILENWERFEAWGDQHPLWRRWRRVYALRVAIEVAVERVVVWPDLGCRGVAEVEGAPLPADPPAAQSPPGKGTGPRVDHARAAKRAQGLPHTLLGWIGADGFPVAVPAEVAGTEPGGIRLRVPPGVVPPGGRRAGLTAHWFSRYVIGQNQRKHTGWLEAEPHATEVLYAPHTESSYRFPESRTLFKLVSGYGTRRDVRGARRAGFYP
jgi:hypothetical protein